jgi:hypothetical protein
MNFSISITCLVAATRPLKQSPSGMDAETGVEQFSWPLPRPLK